MTETDIKATNSSSSADLSDSTDKGKTATPVQPVVSTPVSQPTQPTQSTMGGGEKTVAKDPKGMFDYPNCETYKVTRGDKLIDVAFKYHVALQQLRYFNHLDKATMEIKPDQVLYIPDKPVNVPVGK